MTQPLLVQLTEAAFAALRLQADARAQSPEQAAAEALEQRFGQTNTGKKDAARGDFRRWFGAIHGDFGSADNEAIDSDLAREYGRDLGSV